MQFIPIQTFRMLYHIHHFERENQHGIVFALFVVVIITVLLFFCDLFVHVPWRYFTGTGVGYDSQWVNELSICIYVVNVYQYNDYENCPLSLLKPKCVWRSIHYTYQTFLALRIWCTDHLCDSCGLTDVNILFRHRFRWLQYVNNWWPIVTWSIYESAACNCDVTMANCSYVVSMDVFLSLWSWRPRFEDFVNTLLC